MNGPATVDDETIPDGRWISLATVAAAVQAHAEILERKCIERGIAIHAATGSQWARVRMQDLDALVGATLARSIHASCGPEFVKAELVAPILGVAWPEVIALVERRGVVVRRGGSSPTISYGAAVCLGKILGLEREFPIDDEDWFRGEMVLPRLRAAQRTLISGGYEREWAIDTSDPGAPRVNFMRELSERCRWLSIRWRKGGGTPAQRSRTRQDLPWMIVGFDLYRLAGIAMDPARVPAYREMMAEARQAVLAAEPADVAGVASAAG